MTTSALERMNACCQMQTPGSWPTVGVPVARWTSRNFWKAMYAGMCLQGLVRGRMITLAGQAAAGAQQVSPAGVQVLEHDGLPGCHPLLLRRQRWLIIHLDGDIGAQHVAAGHMDGGVPGRGMCARPHSIW